MKLRSGTKFVCNSLCNCEEQRLKPFGKKVICTCPHRLPYTIDGNGKIEEL